MAARPEPRDAEVRRMKRCAIYVRVSLDEQVEKFGLPAQLRACREYATKHGYSIVYEIADEGELGGNIDRPGLNRVRELARSRDIDVLVALDCDRISR